MPRYQKTNRHQDFAQHRRTHEHKMDLKQQELDAALQREADLQSRLTAESAERSRLEQSARQSAETIAGLESFKARVTESSLANRVKILEAEQKEAIATMATLRGKIANQDAELVRRGQVEDGLTRKCSELIELNSQFKKQEQSQVVQVKDLNETIAELQKSTNDKRIENGKLHTEIYTLKQQLQHLQKSAGQSAKEPATAPASSESSKQQVPPSSDSSMQVPPSSDSKKVPWPY